MTHRPDVSDLSGHSPGRPWHRRFRVPLAAAAALVAAGTVFAVIPGASAAVSFPVESLNGAGNNVNNPTFGQAGNAYSRVGTAHYADGISTMNGGNAPRNTSNRIISDVHKNVFSERRVTQWAWTWGQFMDHTFGLRNDTGAGATAANIPFSATDPLEEFTNNLGVIPFTRSAAHPGTGTSTANPRQQTNTLASYINGNPVYGTDANRLDWLRDGTRDGNPTNNAATMMLPGGYLPRRTARGNVNDAPAMETVGRLLNNPGNAVAAGDKRANENIALTATHTLFAREHNRIVGLLPSSLSQEDKFQIARRVVMAEQQYVTYNEFLPAMGVALAPYTGYKNNINTNLSNEFATVGYRAHSQIHGEFEIDVKTANYSQAQFDAFRAQAIEVLPGDVAGVTELVVPLNVAFSNPDLLQAIGLGPVLAMLGDESQYNNDETIDNTLRTVLMQIPVSNNPDCIDAGPACFNGVNDLGAIDIQRGRDHGIGTYNQLRQAYGLPAKTSFTAITGEATDAFPAGLTINSPGINDIQQLFDVDGNPIDLNDEDAVEATGVRDVRRTTVAARLRGVYGNVNNIDAFTGLISEAHVAGTEMGELQLAIWTREFTRLRDGDRFYIGNAASGHNGLDFIRSTYGIDFRKTLGEVILANAPDVTGADLQTNVFLDPDANFGAATCDIDYNLRRIDGTNTFSGTIDITNTSNQFIAGWAVRWQWAQGQAIRADAGINITQSGPGGRNVTGTDVVVNRILAPGETEHTSFTANFDGVVNARPFNFTLNNRRCTTPQQRNQ